MFNAGASDASACKLEELAARGVFNGFYWARFKGVVMHFDIPLQVKSD